MNAAPLLPSDESLMQLALGQARAAAEAGETPVGAVIMDPVTGHIVSVGANHPIGAHDPTAHAEIAAIRNAAAKIGNYRLTDLTLVVTLEPCAMCAGAIVLARVGALVFGAWDEKAGMCGSVGDLVRHPRLNHRPQVRGGVLEQESAALLQEFFARRR